MDIITALFLGAMCGMGVGSAGLFVTYLVIAMGMEQIRAQGTNLAFFLCAGLSSLPIHLKKRSLSVSRIIRIAIPAAVFSVIGSLVSGYIPAVSLKKAFGLLLILAGAVSSLRSIREIRDKIKIYLRKNQKNT